MNYTLRKKRRYRGWKWIEREAHIKVVSSKWKRKNEKSVCLMLLMFFLILNNIYKSFNFLTFTQLGASFETGSSWDLWSLPWVVGSKLLLSWVSDGSGSSTGSKCGGWRLNHEGKTCRWPSSSLAVLGVVSLELDVTSLTPIISAVSHS